MNEFYEFDAKRKNRIMCGFDFKSQKLYLKLSMILINDFENSRTIHSIMSYFQIDSIVLI